MKALEKKLVFFLNWSFEWIKGYFSKPLPIIKEMEHVLFKEFGLIVMAKTNFQANNFPLLTITPYTNTLNAKENNLMLSFDV
jgi:hypothetical protein